MIAIKPSSVSIALLLLLSDCHQEEFTPAFNIPESIKPVVETFLDEAAKRGKDIAITNLIVLFDASTASPCGRCNSMELEAEIQKIIHLKEVAYCWNYDEELEALVFHELGHCILGRDHASELLPNGSPRSLMMPDQIDVYAPCLYDLGGGTCDKTYRREYYLDELFTESTPVPDWGN